MYARFVKHRSEAQGLVEHGGVRVNRVLVAKCSHTVKCQDVLTIAVHGRVHVVRVLGEAERRGPAAAARLLYAEITPNPHEGAAQKQDASPSPLC